MIIGVPKQLNITTKDTAGEITTLVFEKLVYSIQIKNKGSSKLYVSFDYGESWIEIDPNEEIKVEPFVTKSKQKPIVLLKSDGANEPVRIIYRLIE